MDDNTREKLRPVLYIAAGAYLIYLAVHMLQDLGAMTGNRTHDDAGSIHSLRYWRCCDSDFWTDLWKEDFSGCSGSGCIRGS